MDGSDSSLVRPSVFPLCLLIIGALSIATSSFAQSTGTFSPTGDMSSGRWQLAATRLLNDNTMVSGGYSAGTTQLQSVDLFDPFTGVFTPTGAMVCPHVLHTSTLLTNGNVLIAGGETSSSTQCAADSNGTQPAELWDAETGAFSFTGRYRSREHHAATTMIDGRVLITGGFASSNPGTTLNTTDIYNPTSGTFTSGSNLRAARFGHISTLLTNGLVLIADGEAFSDQSLVTVTSSELYDPSAAQFVAGPSKAFVLGGASTSYQPGGEGAEATLLRDGHVLIAGGGPHGSNSVAIYDPLSNSYLIPPTFPSQHRGDYPTALLDDFSVLAAGVNTPDNDSVGTISELFSPLSYGWSTTGSLDVPRFGDAGGLLTNGQMLVAGGYNSAANEGYASALVYTPQTMPAVRISSPAPYSTVEGTVDILAERGSGVAWVNAYVDGTYLASSPPSEFKWNSASVHQGLHNLSIAAFNGSGQKVGADTILVKVINSQNVALTQPIANETVAGKILIVTEKSPAVKWENVYIDGHFLASSPPNLFTWDTTTVSNGTHTVSVTGFNSSGSAIGTDDDNVRVANGNGRITFPQSGNQVAGTVLIDTTSVTDGGGGGWKNIYIDGKYLTSYPPVNFAWDSTSTSDGSHTISLAVFNDNGQQIGTDSISIKVAN